jgi:hypothetical protein
LAWPRSAKAAPRCPQDSSCQEQIQPGNKKYQLTLFASGGTPGKELESRFQAWDPSLEPWAQPPPWLQPQVLISENLSWKQEPEVGGGAGGREAPS